jgi:hypothetical protein
MLSIIRYGLAKEPGSALMKATHLSLRKLGAAALESKDSTATPLLSSARLRATFWIVAAFFILVGLWESSALPFNTSLAYFLILSACLIPVGLWSYEKSHGMPLYPCFCGFQFLTFGIPLISEHRGVFSYTPEQHLSAALAISVSLSVGTLLWLGVTSKKTVPPSHYLKINLEGGDTLLLSFMFLALFFNINTPFQWVLIPWKYVSLIQPFCNGLSTLAAFILAYRIGSEKANRQVQILFVFCLITNTIMVNTGLYLFLALPPLALALGGYALGKHKIPWLSAILVVGITYFLHAGKNEMRSRYWEADKTVSVKSFTEVIAFYQEWYEASMVELQRPKDEDSSSSLLERNCLLHLTMLMQERLASGLPLMMGDTYTIIPELLVPRILNPDKLWSLEGTTRINVHFGLQSREETLTTTIGWGLLNEGYANFGLWGMILVCAIMGLFLGKVGHFTTGFSIFSSRVLFAIMILSVAVQTENTAGVFITTIFQTAVALAVFSKVFMKRLPHEEGFVFIKTSLKEKTQKRLGLSGLKQESDARN